MSNAKKTGLVNKTSATKGRLKERLKPSSINFGQREYYRLNRVDEK